MHVVNPWIHLVYGLLSVENHHVHVRTGIVIITRYYIHFTRYRLACIRIACKHIRVLRSIILPGIKSIEIHVF